MNGKLNHFFPGANTPKGFYSLFKYILSQEDAKKIICLKGGPGTGKSSLLKKVGQYFNEKGYNIEYHHCSSDNNSLDGIVIPALGVSMLDGTAPHVVDPITPGAVDEIINLGECWREEDFNDSKSFIMRTSESITNTFKRAYRYLSACKSIHDDWSFYNSDALNISKINILKENLKDEILKDFEISSCGKDRHLFATAFTPNGIITYIKQLIIDYDKVYILNGDPGTYKSDILSYILKEALKRNLDVTAFHEPLNPDKLEHLLIPSLKVAIVTSNEINKTSFTGNQIDMEDYQNKKILKHYSKEIKESKDLFYEILNKSLNIMSNVKELHDELEKYYIPNMDFSKVDDTINLIINKILLIEKNKYPNK